MNHIVEVRLSLVEGRWIVSVTKEFAPEHGGGSTVLREDGGTSVHHALDVARGMVTVSPARNPQN